MVKIRIKLVRNILSLIMIFVAILGPIRVIDSANAPAKACKYFNLYKSKYSLTVGESVIIKAKINKNADVLTKSVADIGGLVTIVNCDVIDKTYYINVKANAPGVDYICIEVNTQKIYVKLSIASKYTYSDVFSTDDSSDKDIISSEDIDKKSKITINEFARRVVESFVNGETYYSYTGEIIDCGNDSASFWPKVAEEMLYIRPYGEYGLDGSYLISNVVNGRGFISHGSSRNDYFDGFDSKGNRKYKSTYTYLVSWTDEALKYENELNNELKSIIDELDLEGQPDFYKIKSIHDYVVDRFTYDRQYKRASFGSYGFKNNDKTVCMGYALIMTRLLNMAGIDTLYVRSEGKSAHAWNLVRYNNKYYHLDATWDDPYNILSNDNNDPRSEVSIITYRYFMKSEADLLEADTSDAHNKVKAYSTERFKKTYPLAEESLEY